ncbi:UNVERIFIED_CONTAM: hypothetical protein K2H54_020153 [Gekko kuhli]
MERAKKKRFQETLFLAVQLNTLHNSQSVPVKLICLVWGVDFQPVDAGEITMLGCVGGDMTFHLVDATIGLVVGVVVLLYLQSNSLTFLLLGTMKIYVVNDD